MRPSIVLSNLLGVDKKGMRTVLHGISNELHDYIRDTALILVTLDSMTSPVLTRAARNKFKGLKNVEEHIFHPGGNSTHFCRHPASPHRSYSSMVPDLIVSKCEDV